MIDNTNADADLEEMETEIVDFLGPFTAFLDQSRVDVTIEWPTADNFYGEPVEVTVSGPYQPFLPGLIGLSEINLQAKTTMKIAH